MKKDLDFDVEQAIAAMRSAASGDVRSVGRIETPEENVRAVEGLRAAAADPEHRLRTICGGCEEHVSLLDVAGLCECKRFICKSCEAAEEEGVCDHEPITTHSLGALLASGSAIAMDEDAERKAVAGIMNAIDQMIGELGVPPRVRFSIYIGLLLDVIFHQADDGAEGLTAAQNNARRVGNIFAQIADKNSAQEMRAIATFLADHVVDEGDGRKLQ